MRRAKVVTPEGAESYIKDLYTRLNEALSDHEPPAINKIYFDKALNTMVLKLGHRNDMFILALSASNSYANDYGRPLVTAKLFKHNPYENMGKHLGDDIFALSNVVLQERVFVSTIVSMTIYLIDEITQDA